MLAYTGRTITDWGNRWWKFGFEHGDWLTDTTGEFSPLGDVRDPVYFAQGSTGEPLELEIEVPRGQLMLLPITTFIWTFFISLRRDPLCPPDRQRELPEERQVDLPEARRAQGREYMSSLIVPVNRYLPHVFVVDAGPIMEDGYGGILPALQGGYWAMLEPLSPGVYCVEFGATIQEIDPYTGEIPENPAVLDFYTRLTVRIPGSTRGSGCRS